MSNPTSNFLWQMPTAVDLVTDLPADFEVFGQAVDTSLADLKGGTTGQILSKASNTNMDFTWITSSGDIEGVTAGTGISGGGTTGTVTITNSMATAIDAKGDLVAGTGADTFASLAVGTNDFILQAASGEATGLKWGGGWTSYTPAWTASSNPSIGNGSLTGGFRRIGNQIDFWIDLVAGSTTTFGSGSWQLSLPVVISTANFNWGYNCWILDTGTAWFRGYVGDGTNALWTDKFEIYNPTFASLVSSTSPMTWTNGDALRIQGRYRVSA